MQPRYPVVTAHSQGINPNNDSRHNRTDANHGGGPRKNAKHVPQASRGGFGAHGQKRYHGSASGRPKPTASNPASRGGTPGSFHPERRNPNAGGGVQTKAVHRGMQRQFGTSGKAGVVNDYQNANPKPGRGNVAGRMHRRIAGRFNNASKGSNASGIRGSFGSMPVTTND